MTCNSLQQRAMPTYAHGIAAGSAVAQIPATIVQHPTKKTAGRRTMRAMGLVLLSIAIMALLLADADAKRRSSAQGSQAAGASRSWCAVHPRHGSENCGYTSFDQCWATIGAEGGWCRPNPFSATPYGTGYTWPGPKRQSCGGG